MSAQREPPVLVIATTNRGKLREFEELLRGLPLALRSPADSPDPPVVEENGATYADNALLKATALARWSGHAALADDSGLEVDALGGAPGVHSARYAGPEQDARANVAALLHALQGVAAEKRAARFRCVLAVARPDGATLVVEGECRGRITAAPRGGGGFGYDPVFLYEPEGSTFAEMPAETKQRVSHRARACAVLRTRLMEFLAARPASRPAGDESD